MTDNEHAERNAPSVSTATPDLGDRNRQLMQDLFPAALADGELDCEQLRLELGDIPEAASERYSFTWAGKREAIRLVQVPSSATLVPDRDASKDFDSASHVFIRGENLEVLKLLFKPYFGRFKAIYIDPPYNTGNEFVYPDDYTDPLDTYLRITEQRDEEGNVLTSNVETSGRFHSSWLSMMYPRLFMGRQLLAEDGVLFVSIDDNESHHLRLLLNEIFGEENFLAQVTVQSNPKGRGLAEGFARSHDYIVAYARSKEDTNLSVEKSEEEVRDDYPEEDDRGRYRLLELRNTHKQFGKHNRPNLYYPLYADPETGEVFLESATRYIEILPHWNDGYEGCWTWSQEKARRQRDGLRARKVNGRWKVYRKSYVTPKKLKTIWTDNSYHTEKGSDALEELGLGDAFDFPKPVELIKTCVDLATQGRGDELVLDFFAGAATTAQAVTELNADDGGTRRFMMVQLQEPLDEPIEGPSGRELATLADVGLERARQVLNDGDGIRVFDLAASNYKRWAGVAEQDPEEYVQQMQAFTDPLVDDWTPEAVLWEVAIKEGLSLDATIEELTVDDNTVHCMTEARGERTIFVCLDDKIQSGLTDQLDLTADTLLVTRDNALDDEMAANLALQCRFRTI